MFFAWDITIPAGTLEKDSVTQMLKLSKGVITRADIKFPAGCHGMVKVKLFRFEYPLAPRNREQWITGDSETVPSEGYYDLVETPAELKFMGCSPGTSYDHTITVRVQVLPREVATFMPLIDIMTKFFRKLGVF